LPDSIGPAADNRYGIFASGGPGLSLAPIGRIKIWSRRFKLTRTRIDLFEARMQFICPAKRTDFFFGHTS
jgi:hypothetical protein